jgi:transcriptional/translational regulatory protein YebC/TACO1
LNRPAQHLDVHWLTGRLLQARIREALSLHPDEALEVVAEIEEMKAVKEVLQEQGYRVINARASAEDSGLILWARRGGPRAHH